MNWSEKYNLNLIEGKDFKTKVNHWIPRRMGSDVFVFGKTMYFKNTYSEIPKHEYLHIAQFRKYGRLRVAWHYFVHLRKNKKKYDDFAQAFAAVPFEVEARAYETDCNL